MAKKRPSTRHQVSSFQQKWPRVEADGFVLPDDITDLCQFLDDGEGVELPPVAEQEKEVLRRKNEQIRRLKMEKRALKRDLERSRRVGNGLEADLNRLQRQRRKELIDARHAQRSLSVREKKIADREQACNNLQEDVLRLKDKLSEEIRAYQHNEVIAVVENLVESVELSAKTDTNINKMQEEIVWLRFQESDLKDYCRSLVKEWRVTEELVAVEQQLSNEHEELLTTEVEANQLRLQDEQHTCTQLRTVCALQLGELACKTAWFESVTLANVPLKSRLSAKIEEIGEIEAERDDWQHQTNQLQREREAFQAEQVKQQNRIQAECSKLQNELRTAQLRELRSQQQLRIAQMIAKQAQCEQERLQVKLKTFEAEAEITKRKENTLLPQLHVPSTPKLTDVEWLHCAVRRAFSSTKHFVHQSSVGDSNE